ncbi:Major facilitator super domain-containing protein 7 [Chytriomyces hyalinus]|nr:Major facilitator super domain-containing protein 7 [Chytriomyces hyalinus]
MPTLSPLRFEVATGVFFANFNNALLWATYAAVTPTTADYYGCSEYTINLVALVFQIVFIPAAIPSMYAIDRLGLRFSVLVGTWGVTLGAAIRWLAVYAGGGPSVQLTLLFAGQIIAAIATPFAFNAPTKVCAVWFGDRERLTANTIMSLSVYAGTSTALALSPFIVSQDSSNISKLNFVTFAIVFVTGFSSLFVFDKPEFAPSKSAAEVKHEIPFKQGLYSIATNKQFLLIFLSYGVTIGALYSYFTLLSDYVTPYGYTEMRILSCNSISVLTSLPIQADAGALGNVTILIGTGSSLILGPILDRTKAHRRVLKILPITSLLGSIGFYLSVSFMDRRPLLYISAALIGMGAFCITPIALELGVECTYPVAEGSSAGLLQSAGQAFAVLALLVSNALRGKVDGSLGGAMVWRIAMCAAVVLVVPFYNAKSLRMESEGQGSTGMETGLESGSSGSEEGSSPGTWIERVGRGSHDTVLMDLFFNLKRNPLFSGDFDRIINNSNAEIENVAEASAHNLNQYFSQFLGTYPTQFDVLETPKSYVVHADLPGIKKEDVDISVREGVLTVCGQRASEEAKQPNINPLMLERVQGRFCRSLRLPSNLDMEEVKASLELGVLSLTIAKKKADEEAVKKIHL